MKPVSRAFSLIEILCGIGLVAVLLAIMIPVLSSTHKNAQSTLSLSRIRECGSLIASHANDHQGHFPLAPVGKALIDSRGPTAEIRLPDGGIVGVSWFGQSSAWNLVLIGAGEPPTEVFYSPSEPADPIFLPFSPTLRPTDYILTHTTMAAPDYWRSARNQTADLCRSMKAENVRSPAQKGILQERSDRIALRQNRGADGYRGLPHPLCFADGHALERSLVGAGATIPNSLSGGADYPVLTTLNGLSGIDF